MAWLFFAAVGLLDVVVVVGMAFGGAAVTFRGIRRLADAVRIGVRRGNALGAGQSTFALRSGLYDCGDGISLHLNSTLRHRVETRGPR